MPGTYHVDGLRPIKQGTTLKYHDGDLTVDDERSAAQAFADRMARAAFGQRRGYCRHVRLDSWREDHTAYTFEAFIGRDAIGGNCTVGRNVWLYVKIR